MYNFAFAPTGVRVEIVPRAVSNVIVLLSEEIVTFPVVYGPKVEFSDPLEVPVIVMLPKIS